MELELFEQLGWRVPDVILYPTGGGVGLIGIFKALQECQELGWIGPKLPRLVAVQASGCAPIVKAWETRAEQSQAWQDASTIAFGITVPKPLGDFPILSALYGTGGCAVAVTDAEILDRWPDEWHAPPETSWLGRPYQAELAWDASSRPGCCQLSTEGSGLTLTGAPRSVANPDLPIAVCCVS